jgi:serine/threonine-protein phosphatase PGAM5
LSEVGISLDKVVVSTMTRAQETANLILKQIPKSDSIKRDDCKMLEEGAVCKPSKKYKIKFLLLIFKI